MSTTNYPGIDYAGPGSTVNRDSLTGIRYGIIRGNDLMAEVLDDITVHGEDLGFKAAEEELKTELRHALEDYFSDWADSKRLTNAVENAFDALDGWADGIDTSGPWQWEKEGYSVRLAEDGDVWVFKSPFYTYAQFCSPCAPGACHLGNPLDVKVQAGIASILNAGEGETFVNSNQCYCLDRSWFDDEKAPYRMWRVDTNEEVL